MILYIIEYAFLTLFGIGLLFMALTLRRLAFKAGKPLKAYKIFFWIFCLVFIAPFLYFVGFLIYNDISEYQNGLNRASIRFGYINKKGGTVIPFQFNAAGPFEHGYAYVTKGADSYWIDSLGNKARNQKLHYSHEPVKRNFYKRMGGECLEDDYRKYHEGEVTQMNDSCTEGLCIIRLVTRKYTSYKGYHYLKFRYGFRDTAGNTVIAPAFLNVFGFREGLALAVDTTGAATGLRVGFIDRRGQYIIHPAYDYAMDFSEGKAAVSKVTRE